MHRVVNYGSFLQTYATQKIIETLGYKCEIIDYKYPNNWQYSHGVPAPNKLRNRMKVLVNKLISPLLDVLNLSKGGVIKRSEKLKVAVEKYLNLSPDTYNTYESLQERPPQYDVYLTGSDQTWNVNHMKGDPNFLLGFVNTSAPRIALSASMTTNMEDLELDKVFNKYLPMYSAISIREKGNVERVKKLSHKEDVAVTLDPTLLLSSEEWLSLLKGSKISLPKEGYIVLYMLNYAFDPQPYIYKLLQYLQKQTGLIVLTFSSIPSEYRIKSRYVGRSGVEDFINIFSKASYVVTSSFHGTVFSLNFDVPLYSIVPQNFRNQDSRQIDVLETLEANEYIVPIGTDFSDLKLNFSEEYIKNIHNRLIQERSKSILWLKTVLSNLS